jgi:hypothetical protein
MSPGCNSRFSQQLTYAARPNPFFRRCKGVKPSAVLETATPAGTRTPKAPSGSDRSFTCPCPLLRPVRKPPGRYVLTETGDGAIHPPALPTSGFEEPGFSIVRNELFLIPRLPRTAQTQGMDETYGVCFGKLKIFLTSSHFALCLLYSCFGYLHYSLIFSFFTIHYRCF